MRPRIVSEVNRCRLKTENVAHEWTHVNLWMWLDNLNLIFKVDWTVTFYLKLLCVGLSDKASLAHVNELREELVL